MQFATDCSVFWLFFFSPGIQGVWSCLVRFFFFLFIHLVFINVTWNKILIVEFDLVLNQALVKDDAVVRLRDRVVRLPVYY